LAKKHFKQFLMFLIRFDLERSRFCHF